MLVAITITPLEISLDIKLIFKDQDKNIMECKTIVQFGFWHPYVLKIKFRNKNSNDNNHNDPVRKLLNLSSFLLKLNLISFLLKIIITKHVK